MRFKYTIASGTTQPNAEGYFSMEKFDRYGLEDLPRYFDLTDKEIRKKVRLAVVRRIQSMGRDQVLIIETE